MKTNALLTLLLLLALGLLQSPAAESEKSTQELITQLGDHHYQNREEANLKLWNLGDQSLPLLQENKEHPHPEIRLRIKQLVADIQVGILPDTPEDVKKMIRDYATASPSKKVVTLAKLQKLKLHKQIIRLYMIEQDEKVSQDIAKQAKEAVERLVQELLNQDQAEQAITLLKRYNKIDGSLNLLGKLLLRQGTLTTELKTEKDPAIRLVYARLLGDIPLVRQLATELNDEKLLATLALLDGDLLPYLALKQDLLKDKPLKRTAGYQLMIHRLRNETKKADELASTLSENLSQDGSDDSLKALIANGYLNLALGKMDTHFAAEKLAFAELGGNWKEVLAPYELTPGEKISSEWIKDESAKIIKYLSKSSTRSDDYYRLVIFFQTQNELQESSRLLKPILNHILNLDSSEITEEFFKEMLNLELIPTVLHALDDDSLLHAPTATTLLTNLISQGYDEELHLAEALDKIHPNQSRYQKLTTLAGCLGYISHPREHYAQTAQAFLNYLKKNFPPNEQISHLKTLFRSARINGHHELSLSTLDQLIEFTSTEAEQEQDLHTWLEAKLAILSNLGEWDQMLAILKDHPSLGTGSPNKIARYAMVQHRSGNRQQAQTLLQESLKLATTELKSSASTIEIITNFSQLDIAHPHLIQTALSAPLKSSEWSTAFYHLGVHAKKNQNWKQASAISYLFASLYMESYQSFKNLYSAWEKNMEGDTYRAATLAQANKTSQATALLQNGYDNCSGKVQLADVFFPVTRKAGLTQLHNQLYQDAIAQEIKKAQTYPLSHNHKNSLAWLSSCAQLNLDQAETWVAEAIKAQPENFAYLHTMAEVHHAKGNHDKAIDWCTQALQRGANTSAQMRDELDRFKKAAESAPIGFPELNPAPAE